MQYLTFWSFVDFIAILCLRKQSLAMGKRWCFKSNENTSSPLQSINRFGIFSFVCWKPKWVIHCRSLGKIILSRLWASLGDYLHREKCPPFGKCLEISSDYFKCWFKDCLSCMKNLKWVERKTCHLAHPKKSNDLQLHFDGKETMSMEVHGGRSIRFLQMFLILFE